MPSTEQTQNRGNGSPPKPGDAEIAPEVRDLLAELDSIGVAPKDRARLLSESRQCSRHISQQIDMALFDRIDGLRRGLVSARNQQEELRSVLNRLVAPPLFPAVYLGPTQLPAPEESEDADEETIAGAMVQHGSSRRHVPLAAGVDQESIQIGDEVLLNSDMSVVIGKSPLPSPPFGDMAVVDRVLEDNRLLVQSGPEQRVIGVAATVRGEPWSAGDPVRWDRNAALAYERLARDDGKEFLLQSVADTPLGHVGGLSQVRDELISVLTLALSAPDVAKRYGLGGQRTILLVGPPGVGKTLLAKIAGAEIQRRLGRRCSILVVKPSAFEDPYVGVTQQKIRQCFQALRQAKGFGLLFLDEIESVGRARGSAGSVGFHNDKFLASLLAEIEGFESDGADGDAPTALIAATNRIEMLDPALVERMQVQIRVPRPDLRAAREIFDIHLPPELSYNPNGDRAPQTRREIIERAISLLYSQNASALCTVRFRDNTQRVVYARELTSGRCIQQISRAAKQAAAYREVRGGAPGLRLGDIEDAAAGTIESLAATLSRTNIHQYVADLRQDLDVVAVEPIVRRVSRPHRFLSDEYSAA
jgi:proteasome-associated ATPase